MLMSLPGTLAASTWPPATCAQPQMNAPWRWKAPAGLKRKEAHAPDVNHRHNQPTNTRRRQTWSTPTAAHHHRRLKQKIGFG